MNAEFFGDQPMLELNVVIDGYLRKISPVEWGGVLLGDEDNPLPSRFGTIMKYSLGSSAISFPINHSF